MRRSWTAVAGVALGLTVSLAGGAGADPPAQAVAAARPPWRRFLEGEEAKRAAQLEQRVAERTVAGKLAEALGAAGELAELRTKLQGADHYEAITARWNVEAIQRALRGNKESQAAYAGKAKLQQQADALVGEARYQKAQPLLERILDIHRTVLGDHPITADSYNNVAYCLDEQDKSPLAEPLYHKALAIQRGTLGEEHPDTATSYNNLAYNLSAQGKYVEADPLYRKALEIRRQSLGEDNPDTAVSYNSLAVHLSKQGRYAEAEPLYHKALDIQRKILGDDHPDTAVSYNNLADNLEQQGKSVEAEPLYRRALVVKRKALGEDHPDTAMGYNNLAYNLTAQRRFAEAEPLLRKALAIRRKALGEEHHRTAITYNNMAGCLRAQGKYSEAEPLLQHVLAIWRKTLGEDHPHMAQGYNNVAYNLHDQGKYAEAEPLFRKALAGRRLALGEDHPDTAGSYSNLAANLAAQGRYAQAEELYEKAAERFTRSRLWISVAGLDRAAVTGTFSPYPEFACILARNGKSEAAWQRFEESLARGTGDDLSARQRRPPVEQAKQAELIARLVRFDRLVERATSRGEPTPEQKRKREDLLTKRRQAQDELEALARQLEEKYGPAAGQVIERPAIQAALAADAALVGWVDLAGAPKAADPDGEHWAFLLRARGEPAVVRLKGTGPDGHWTEADTKLPAELRSALQSSLGDWKPLAERLRRQRLDPLADCLTARAGLPVVRHLIVLPSTALAGVPAEAFADGYTVSYALSGTLYAHLRQQPAAPGGGLLAVADPVFDRPATLQVAPPPLPPGGLLVTSVIAGGNAAKAGMKAGDVLLQYNGGAVAARADLKTLPESEDAAKRVPVTVWRDGKTTDKELRPGKLGVVLANDPAPQALAAKYEGDRLLAKARGGDDGDWGALPGTRVEAEGLRKLFAGAGPAPLVLADSDASEQRLYDLAKSGDLGKYRYLHLATHGTVDDRFPLRSAVILARDHLPDPDKQLDAGLPLFDGRLTAEEVLRQWHLNADLVTLSACQTALGKYEKGEGFVGFAQALILAGSRSVCLSLWKVDDTATALLMGRFYENLLGKRAGLKGPMGKAAALVEAKAWLRGLPAGEAAQRAAKMSDGVARGPRPALPKVKAAGATAGASVVPDGDRPYAHPYYWAAFVLIGDPG